MRPVIFAAFGLWLAAACAGGGGPSTPPSRTDAPPRDACQVDADCIATGLGPHPASSNPCCTGYGAEVVSKRFEAWRAAQRAAQCPEPVPCPPLLPPAPPPPGFFEARCKAGACVRGR